MKWIEWNWMYKRDIEWNGDREDMSICDEDDVIDIRMVIKIK